MSTRTTIQQAALNRDRLLRHANSLPEGTDEYNRAAFGFANETDIIETAKQIHSTIGRIKERLAMVTRELDHNTPQCLNTSGILQGLNHDLDAAVVKINLFVKNRSVYENLLQTKGTDL